MLKEDAALFDLGHLWTKSGGKWRPNEPTERNPYVLFIERCFDMLKDGGRVGIVLPETAFHAPSMEYLRAWITRRSRILAVIDLPHNTFRRPHCNAKTCLLVAEKGGDADKIIMAEAIQMGHDHQGKVIYRPRTDEVWNDLPLLLAELDDPDNKDNEFVFSVFWQDILYPDTTLQGGSLRAPPRDADGSHSETW